MIEYERLLVALSLTERDKSLFDYCRMLMKQFSWRDVHFAHVAAEEAHSWLEPLREEIHQHLGDSPSVRHTLHVAEGDRLDQILRLVVEREHDLVLLGHRRNRSGRRSLARRLAMVSPASVWLVPEGSLPQVSNVLVPVDYSDCSADALAVAADIAKKTNSQLTAVHVYSDSVTLRSDEHSREVELRQKADFEKFLADIDTQGIEVEPLLVEGTRIATDILRTARRCGSDLIVMCTRGRSKAASILLGSTASETMAATTIPMLAVKHFGSRMTLMQALVDYRIWDQKSTKSK